MTRRPILLVAMAAVMAMPAPVEAQLFGRWRARRAAAQVCVDANGNGVCDTDESMVSASSWTGPLGVTRTRVVERPAVSYRYASPRVTYRSGGSAAYSAAYAEPVYSAGSHGGYAVQVVAPAEDAPPRASEAGVASCPCGENCQCCQDLRDENERLEAENARLKARLGDFGAKTSAVVVPARFERMGLVVPERFIVSAPSDPPQLLAARF